MLGLSLALALAGPAHTNPRPEPNPEAEAAAQNDGTKRAAPQSRVTQVKLQTPAPGSRFNRQGKWLMGTGGSFAVVAVAGGATWLFGGHTGAPIGFPLWVLGWSAAMPLTMSGAGVNGRHWGWRGRALDRTLVRQREIGGWTSFGVGLLFGLGGGVAAMLWPKQYGDDCRYCVTHQAPVAHGVVVTLAATGPVIATVGGSFGAHASAHRFWYRPVSLSPTLFPGGMGVAGRF